MKIGAYEIKNYFLGLQQKNHELEEEIEELKEDIEEYKRIESKDLECIQELKQRIDKAIEILKLCNSKCSKEVIKILEGDK